VFGVSSRLEKEIPSLASFSDEPSADLRERSV
jgi:hypothetical protein